MRLDSKPNVYICPKLNLMKVETLELRDWEDLETGLVVAENDEWVMLRYIYADYMLDGWKLIKKDLIAERISEEDEAQIAKVIALKGETGVLPMGFKLGSALEMIQWINNRYGFVEFQDEEEEVIFAVVTGQEEGNLLFDMVLPDGQVEAGCEIGIDDVGVIAFDGDYFQSVGLLWKADK